MKTFLLPVLFFSRLEFSRKHLVCFLFCVVHYFNSHTPQFSTLACGMDRPLIAHDEKSPPQTGAFVEICVSTLKISLPNIKTKNPQKASSTALMAPRQQVVTLNGAMSKGKAIGATEGRSLYKPSINRKPPKTSASPRVKGQPLVPNHHRNTKISSF